METHWDYIIIGAGSAGCVLAHRLSADPKINVLLLEAGGSDKNILIQMPTALSYPMASPRYNWGYETVPQVALNGRKISCPRGKTLGGTSSINGMVYVRGHAYDFDQWEDLGAKGWSYQHCLPYFKKSETWQYGGDDYRGGNGPLHVGGGNNMRGNPLYQAFINAGHDAGYPITEDYNGKQQEGFGPMHMTVHNGVRESTARAYLDPIKKRKNLSIKTGVLVDKLIIEGGAVRALQLQNGESIAAQKEIILSAGAIASPAILQRSGVGPREVLDNAGIDMQHELPGVGENLQDHLEVYFQFHCKQPVTLNDKLSLWSKFWIGARWFFFKSGLGATNHFESCAFIRSNDIVKWPDIQYHFLPAAIRYDGTPSLDGHGFQVHVGPNKPKSRGHVRIQSADPLSAPHIDACYLTHQDDINVWRQCIHLTRNIIAQKSLDEYRGDELHPGAGITSDDNIDRWVQDNVESAYHHCGTCKMGNRNDPMAVVDPACKLIGIRGVRIVDASIFPTITNGNINAPTIMVAEKAADMILSNMTV